MRMIRMKCIYSCHSDYSYIRIFMGSKKSPLGPFLNIGLLYLKTGEKSRPRQMRLRQSNSNPTLVIPAQAGI
jgi:hypothetical protein